MNLIFLKRIIENKNGIFFLVILFNSWNIIDVDHENEWLKNQKNYEICIYGKPRHPDSFYHREYFFVLYCNRRPEIPRSHSARPSRNIYDQIVNTHNEIIKRLTSYNTTHVYLYLICDT